MDFLLLLLQLLLDKMFHLIMLMLNLVKVRVQILKTYNLLLLLLLPILVQFLLHLLLHLLLLNNLR
jgi:hypothetical protein